MKNKNNNHASSEDIQRSIARLTILAKLESSVNAMFIGLELCGVIIDAERADIICDMIKQRVGTVKK